jgi:hypothetical protein
MKNTIKEMLIGTILGDAHIGKIGLDKAFITFEQSKKKLEYLKFLFELSEKEGLSLNELKTYSRNDSRYNKINESVYFRTRSLEKLKPLADMFLNNDGKKIIPSNISEFLTPRSLAFWIMDDGQQVKRGGVTLCTDSYKSEEVDTLRKALKTNFNLITSIHKKTNKNSESIYERIYINKSSLDNIKPLLKEHMHDSMLYKINETPESLLEEGDITDIDSDIGEF